MKMPNGERADLGLKLEAYVLNPQHRDGRHKARVFESAFGITLADPSPLRQAILAATSRSSASRSGRRRFRHCRASTLSSISAMFSQLRTRPGRAVS